MRRTPIVGTKVWFIPRRFGWGWAPGSWEGWAVTVAFGVILLFAPKVVDGGALVAATVLAIGGLLLACGLKGTAAGGPEALRMYRRQPLPDSDPMARRLDDPSLEDISRRFDHLDDS